MVEEKGKQKAKGFLLTLVYAVIVHVLYLHFYGKVLAGSYDGKLFVYSFNMSKYYFAVLETLLIVFLIDKHVRRETMTDTAMVLLYYLYFIPGVTQQAATNMSWAYIAYFFVFMCFLEFWSVVLKARKGSVLVASLRSIRINKGQMMAAMILLAVGITVVLSFYTRTFFSFSRFMASLHDVYGVRAAASEANFHWILVNFEYWAVYFMIFMLAYYSEKKKWWVVTVLLIAVGAMFVIQANRIFLFLAVVSIFLGLFRVENKGLIPLFAIAGVVLLADVMLFENGSLITDMYRRYAVVPNRLGEQYFDFFLTHEPDYLRTQYARVCDALGVYSPYYSPNIAHIIGRTYYGTNMGANTGMVGSAMFSFGWFGTIISSFGYVASFRLFDSVSSGIRNKKMLMAVAITLVTIAINTGYMLTNIFSLSYFLMLFLSILLINYEDDRKEVPLT